MSIDSASERRTRPRRRWSRVAAILITLLSATACARRGTIEGTVSDFDTSEPLVRATVTAVQHGWGFSDGQLVWDKDRSVSVTTDARGRFAVQFRGGSHVRLRARQPGYQRFETVYPRDEQAAIRLKARVQVDRVVPNGMLRVGVRTDGTMYGWSFEQGAVTDAPEAADLMPASVDPGSRGPITLSAPGGIRFVSATELGVNDHFLVFTDYAPEDGYSTTATLDFDGEGGIYFVRTRDGARFAKFAFTPSGFGQSVGPDVLRDLMLQYVYDPTGSRYLLYQMPE